MPYRVHVPEPLLGPLPPRVRTRVWLALAKIAQTGTTARRGVHVLGEGYRLSYEVDGGTRTVTLLGVERLVESAVLA